MTDSRGMSSRPQSLNCRALELNPTCHLSHPLLGQLTIRHYLPTVCSLQHCEESTIIISILLIEKLKL